MCISFLVVVIKRMTLNNRSTLFTTVATATTNRRLVKRIFASGYDLPVYGLEQHQFLAIHIPALTCIILSLISALCVLVFSFKRKSYKTFFSWTKSERFVVYLAVCDGLFNISHSMDHLHILITRNHPYPSRLCEFYGFMLAEFITAQNLMVNVVSINAFVLIYYRKNLEFGIYDYRLLLWTFGFPFVAAMVALGLGTMGPNGTLWVCMFFWLWCEKLLDYFDIYFFNVLILCLNMMHLFGTCFILYILVISIFTFPLENNIELLINFSW